MSLQNDLNRAVSIYGAGRIVSGKSVLDRNWQADLFRNWAGLSVYRQLTGPAISKYTSLSKRNTSLAHDLGKTLSIIAVSSLLEGSVLIWSRLLMVIVGTAIYHYLVHDQLIKAFSSSVDPQSLSWLEDWTENILIMMLSDFVQGDPVDWKSGMEQLIGLGVYYWGFSPTSTK